MKCCHVIKPGSVRSEDCLIYRYQKPSKALLKIAEHPHIDYLIISCNPFTSNHSQCACKDADRRTVAMILLRIEAKEKL